jgi:rubrerythrin
MGAQQITASIIISFSRRLQEDSARFYEELAERFPDQRRVFEGYARRCERNGTQIVRTYQETITDALEAGFAFEGLSLSEYRIDVELPDEVDLDEAVDRALQLEERAVAFYREVADRSRSLLATIPRAFDRVAKRRGRRIADLKALEEDG